MAKASNVAITIRRSQVPIYAEAIALLQKGIKPGATARNLQHIKGSTNYHAEITELDQQLLCDPQTSGGLLLSVSAEKADELLAACQAQGTLCATIVGSVGEGPPVISVIP